MTTLHPFTSQISHTQRLELMKQTPQLVWLTGLSGSGKTTLALGLEHYLFHQGFKVFLLDGDNIRHGLNQDLGFTAKDRKENLRRVAEVAKLMLDAGLVVICAFISPYEQEREMVRKTVGEQRFLQVFVNCPLATCEARDTKGLYAKARQGLVRHFTGISAPYERPTAPDLQVYTATETIEESLRQLIDFVAPKVVAQL